MRLFKQLVFAAALVAAAASLRADIIWSGLQDAHIFMAPNEPFPTNTFPELSPGILDLDINSDGVLDFSIGMLDAHDQGLYLVSCEDVNSIARGGQYGSTVIPFPSGTLFDASNTWLTEGPYRDSEALIVWRKMYDEPGSAGVGPWAGVTGYMGVQFEVDGETHFGRVNMTVYDEYPGMTIHSWAYESTPETGIVAGAIPEPSTLALLLAGAGGIWMVRKKRFRSRETLPWGRVSLPEPEQLNTFVNRL